MIATGLFRVNFEQFVDGMTFILLLFIAVVLVLQIFQTITKTNKYYKLKTKYSRLNEINQKAKKIIELYQDELEQQQSRYEDTFSERDILKILLIESLSEAAQLKQQLKICNKQIGQTNENVVVMEDKLMKKEKLLQRVIKHNASLMTDLNAANHRISALEFEKVQLKAEQERLHQECINKELQDERDIIMLRCAINRAEFIQKSNLLLSNKGVRVLEDVEPPLDLQFSINTLRYLCEKRNSNDSGSLKLQCDGIKKHCMNLHLWTDSDNDESE